MSNEDKQRNLRIKKGDRSDNENELDDAQCIGIFALPRPEEERTKLPIPIGVLQHLMGGFKCRIQRTRRCNRFYPCDAEEMAIPGLPIDPSRQGVGFTCHKDDTKKVVDDIAAKVRQLETPILLFQDTRENDRERVWSEFKGTTPKSHFLESLQREHPDVATDYSRETGQMKFRLKKGCVPHVSIAAKGKQERTERFNLKTMEAWQAAMRRLTGVSDDGHPILRPEKRPVSTLVTKVEVTGVVCDRISLEFRCPAGGGEGPAARGVSVAFMATTTVRPRSMVGAAGQDIHFTVPEHAPFALAEDEGEGDGGGGGEGCCTRVAVALYSGASSTGAGEARLSAAIFLETESLNAGTNERAFEIPIPLHGKVTVTLSEQGRTLRCCKCAVLFFFSSADEAQHCAVQQELPHLCCGCREIRHEQLDGAAVPTPTPAPVPAPVPRSPPAALDRLGGAGAGVESARLPLDATESRLEAENGVVDNLMAVHDTEPSSSPAGGGGGVAGGRGGAVGAMQSSAGSDSALRPALMPAKLTCAACGADFVLSRGERTYFERKGFRPKRCPTCHYGGAKAVRSGGGGGGGPGDGRGGGRGEGRRGGDSARGRGSGAARAHGSERSIFHPRPRP